MRRPALVAMSLVTALFPSAAHAEEARKLEVGARVGYGFPVGSLERGSRLSDTTFGNVPIWLDATYRVGRFLAIGVYGQYAASIPTQCEPGQCVTNLGNDLRIGLEAKVSLPRLGPVHPWFAVGNGYEWYTSKFTSPPLQSARHYRGFELLLVEAGGDFRLSSRFTLGPFVSATLGRFSHLEVDAPSLTSWGDVRGGAFHGWLSLGVRTAFSF